MTTTQSYPEVRVRGRHGTFHHAGPSRTGNAIWVYGPIGSQQRQWTAVRPELVRFVGKTPRAKPKR